MKNNFITTKATECLDCVVWGKNLASTVGEKFTRAELAMVRLPEYIQGVIVGLVLSDG
jgi:hypothetical protein